MHIKPVLTLLLVLGASASLIACGEDDKPATAATTESSDVALRELAATRSGLEEALASYKGGDAAAAEDQISEAYLSHFEHVEGPLEKVDEELTEELEDGIREGLRDDVRSGKPAAQVQRSFEAIYAEMDKAEAALR